MPRLFSSLRFQLIAIVLLSVLPAIALILYSGFEERRNAALHARTNTRRLAELASIQQARFIDEAYRLLLTLSESPHLYSSDAEQCSAYLLDVISWHPHYLNIGVLGTDGRVLCSALPVESRMPLPNEDFFRHALENEGLVIGSAHSRDDSGKASFELGYPVHDSAYGVRGVAFAAVDLAWLSDLAAYLGFPEGATLALTDRDGTVIVRYPDPERWVGKVVSNKAIVKTALEQGKGTMEAVGVDGVNRLYAFNVLGDFAQPVILYTGIPTSTVFAEANRALTRNLITLGIVTILALIVAHVLGHLVVMRRVNALVRATDRIGRGELGARTGMSSGNSELEQLGTALDAMAESLERKGLERDEMEAALRRSEERYRALVEQIPVVTYTAALDEARTILFISPQVECLLGFDEGDFYEDRDTWRKRLHPDDRERVLRESSRCRKENDLFICEYRMLTYHGLVKWIRDEAAVVLDKAGEPLFIQGVMTDITEQKRSEEELVEAHKELEIRVAQRTEALARANEELRQSAETLKSFAASVVHDLRSPAIGAYGLTKLLWKQYGDVLDEKGTHYCDQIMKASEHVVELAEKINVYMATKETPLSIETVSLGELLGALRDEFSSRFSARAIRWVQPERDVEVRADRLSLLRMFRNFIDNALKYGGNRLTEVRIGYEESEQFHVFSVSDDGRGVSREDTEKIFQVFQRSRGSSGVEGAGLGLAIVGEIAEKHGGRVSVEAGKEGGATFLCSISRHL